MQFLGMRARLNAALAICVLYLALASAESSHALTERLAGDSDGMEGVVGAREAEALVDSTLHKYEATQTAAEKAASQAEQGSLIAFQKYDQARKAAAEQEAERRHLKTKLSIVSEAEENDAKIAEKAEAIAKKMAALAEKARSQWQSVQEQKKDTEDHLKSVESQVKLSEADEKLERQKREDAEAAARASSANLAKLDLKITKLLDRRSRLKDMAAAEDKRASSSLAEAFKEDASRQEKFREALSRERKAEQEHRKQEALLRLESKSRMEARVKEAKSAITQQSDKDVKALSTMKQQIWRKNPDLQAFAAKVEPDVVAGATPSALGSGDGGEVAQPSSGSADAGASAGMEVEQGDATGAASFAAPVADADDSAASADDGASQQETLRGNGRGGLISAKPKLAAARGWGHDGGDGAELGRRLEGLLRGERLGGWQIGRWGDASPTADAAGHGARSAEGDRREGGRGGSAAYEAAAAAAARQGAGTDGADFFVPASDGKGRVDSDGQQSDIGH